MCGIDAFPSSGISFVVVSNCRRVGTGRAKAAPPPPSSILVSGWCHLSCDVRNTNETQKKKTGRQGIKRPQITRNLHTSSSPLLSNAQLPLCIYATSYVDVDALLGSFLFSRENRRHNPFSFGQRPILPISNCPFHAHLL